MIILTPRSNLGLCSTFRSMLATSVPLRIRMHIFSVEQTDTELLKHCSNLDFCSDPSSSLDADYLFLKASSFLKSQKKQTFGSRRLGSGAERTRGSSIHTVHWPPSPSFTVPVLGNSHHSYQVVRGKTAQKTYIIRCHIQLFSRLSTVLSLAPDTCLAFKFTCGNATIFFCESKLHSCC